jgi:starvation-inducible DNA-binding protein
LHWLFDLCDLDVLDFQKKKKGRSHGQISPYKALVTLDSPPPINIGINEKDRAVANGLSPAGRHHTLYLTTHSFHWNVTETQCSTRCTRCSWRTPEWAAVDPVMTRRIRSLGHTAPGSYMPQFASWSVPDAPSRPKSAGVVRVRYADLAVSTRRRAACFRYHRQASDRPEPTC